MTHFERKVGQRVSYSGYPGTITHVCEWTTGMVEVRLARGTTCVDFAELIPLSLEDCRALVEAHDAQQTEYLIPTEPLRIMLARRAIAKEAYMRHRSHPRRYTADRAQARLDRMERAWMDKRFRHLLYHIAHERIYLQNLLHRRQEA